VKVKEKGNKQMSKYEKIMNMLIAGDMESLNELVKGALDAGDEATNIFNRALSKGMDIVGEQMQSGEMFIPEVLKPLRVVFPAACGVKCLCERIHT